MAPADPAMEAFYVGLASEAGGPVLELACGTGRLALPLAQAGLDVTGGDLSDEMLAAARASAEHAGLKPAHYHHPHGEPVEPWATGGVPALVVRQAHHEGHMAEPTRPPRFVRLDMRDFDLGQQFETVLIAANSILHLHTEADFRAFFAAVRRHLARSGRLAFDAFVPRPRLLSLPPDARQPVGRFAHAELGEVTLEETIRYDPIAQISHVDWFWSTPDAPDFWRVPLALRQIFPQELPLLLAANGFRLLDRFGDFDRSPLAAGSHRQVCITAPA